MTEHELLGNEPKAISIGATALEHLSRQLKAAHPEGTGFKYGIVSAPKTDGYFAVINQGIGVAVIPNPDGTMEFTIAVPMSPEEKQEIINKFWK